LIENCWITEEFNGFLSLTIEVRGRKRGCNCWLKSKIMVQNISVVFYQTYFINLIQQVLGCIGDIHELTVPLLKVQQAAQAAQP